MAGRLNMARLPETETGISLEAETGSPSAETNRQENFRSAKRFATRRVSSAP